MNSCVFSRSDGAGSATVRNTRGLTRSVIALMVPPLPSPPAARFDAIWSPFHRTDDFRRLRAERCFGRSFRSPASIDDMVATIDVKRLASDQARRVVRQEGGGDARSLDTERARGHEAAHRM